MNDLNSMNFSINSNYFIQGISFIIIVMYIPSKYPKSRVKIKVP